MKVQTREEFVPLPAPAHEGRVALERALYLRRSERELGVGPVTLAELAQLLWAAQGLTELGARRTAPSAGAAYPLEVHVLAGEVDGLAPGQYRYLPRRHGLAHLGAEDLRVALGQAADGQEWLARAPLVVVLTGIDERTTFTYGERGRRYVQHEAGCAAQNVQLQAVGLGLASVVVGAFADADVARLLRLPDWERPLLVLPVGRSRIQRGLPC